MKKSHLLLVTLFIGLTLLMSACVPGPRVVDAPGLALDDTEVFVSYGNFISSLDAADGGTLNWSYPEKANNQIIFYAPPLVTDDAVYVGDLANEFHKLDKATGEAIWTYSGAKGFYLGQAAIQDDVIYAPNNDGSLYALDSNGELLWTFETGHYLWAQPQIANDMIYIGSMDHFVYALSLDGSEIWSYELSGAVTGAPLLSEDGSMLYVGSLGNEMLALDAASGDVVWTFDTSESVWGNSVLAEGNLIFADAAGTIYAVAAESGEPVWQTATSAEIVGGVASIGDGIVVATQEGKLQALAYDGSPMWEASLDGEIIYAPVANSDFLIAGIINGDDLIYGFNLTGVQLWSTTPGK